ncbi:DUF4307 domain-containing protein [Corynebacterium mendelii]|uniref:DUF4307 domain-containing protein n=1 Tax=Corynebacterium mendelii TaxID=2765362 RepID=A0A939E1K3_9CORY|nr:DUF4307 domain-containing protein [Corynebacterium mendelii]MBN9644786.1 DUF4307 domain-containing protein [Corynebacterium mendelii]
MAHKATTPARRSGRYDNVSNESTISGKLVAIAAVVVLFVGLWVVFNYVSNSQKVNVSTTVAGWERITDDEIRIDVDVSRKDPDKASYCIVNALAYDKDEVGRREFLIAPGGPKVQRFSVVIPTTDQAVAAKVYGCSGTIPPYLTTPSSGYQPGQ